MDYKEKYIKYKNKYLELKNIIGGGRCGTKPCFETKGYNSCCTFKQSRCICRGFKIDNGVCKDQNICAYCYHTIEEHKKDCNSTKCTCLKFVQKADLTNTICNSCNHPKENHNDCCK